MPITDYLILKEYTLSYMQHLLSLLDCSILDHDKAELKKYQDTNNHLLDKITEFHRVYDEQTLYNNELPEYAKLKHEQKRISDHILNLSLQIITDELCMKPTQDFFFDKNIKEIIGYLKKLYDLESIPINKTTVAIIKKLNQLIAQCMVPNDFLQVLGGVDALMSIPMVVSSEEDIFTIGYDQILPDNKPVVLFYQPSSNRIAIKFRCVVHDNQESVFSAYQKEPYNFMSWMWEPNSENPIRLFHYNALSKKHPILNDVNPLYKKAERDRQALFLNLHHCCRGWGMVKKMNSEELTTIVEEQMEDVTIEEQSDKEMQEAEEVKTVTFNPGSNIEIEDIENDRMSEHDGEKVDDLCETLQESQCFIM